MIILDKVIEAGHADGILVELGTIEGYWALVMYDDLGDDLKTYQDESLARKDFSDFKAGKLQFNALFGFAKSSETTQSVSSPEISFSM